MADYKHLPKFILLAEGGEVTDTTDTASVNPCPDGTGVHTNKGITWTVWSSKNGTSQDSIDRFHAMSFDDWCLIFKGLFWDKALGDKINSQRIADAIADWLWGSGVHYPELDIQIILDTLFNDHLAEDGCFGQMTVDAINAADEQTLWDDIVARRLKYLKDIVLANPPQIKFLKGWQNRMNNLIAFENS